MVVVDILTKQQFDGALKEDGVMVVDCFATWCGPCKVISPELVKFSDQYSKARFYKVDVDQVLDVAQQLGIRAMPTFIFFKNGKKVQTLVGADPVALENTIKELTV